MECPRILALSALVDCVNTAKALGERWHKAGVGAVGVTDRGVGVEGEAAVVDDLAVGSHEVGSGSNGSALADGNIEEFGHFAVEVAHFFFFAEKIAHARLRMVEWESVDGQCVVFEHPAAVVADGFVNDVE